VVVATNEEDFPNIGPSDVGLPEVVVKTAVVLNPGVEPDVNAAA
jgi:hypothetical protein